MKTLKCDRKKVIEWMYKHLDDCPCDWHTDDFYDDNLTIIFETIPDNPFDEDSQITVHPSLRSGYDATIISTSPTEFPMKETMYLVLSGEHIGLWYARNPKHLYEKVGYKCEYTTKTLHPLTSYM